MKPSTKFYRVLKNNDIMGQILRNKYGSMTIKKIEEVVEIMADGGLRLVNFLLKDEREIQDFAHYLQVKNPEHDIAMIKRELEGFSFLWTMMNIERIVAAINVPEIRPAIERVAGRAGTPAYDVIGYFTLLDAAQELQELERVELEKLLKKHQDPFVRGVLSIRTQHYMNTHRSSAMTEQSICSPAENQISAKTCPTHAIACNARKIATSGSMRHECMCDKYCR